MSKNATLYNFFATLFLGAAVVLQGAMINAVGGQTAHLQATRHYANGDWTVVVLVGLAIVMLAFAGNGPAMLVLGIVVFATHWMPNIMFTNESSTYAWLLGTLLPIGLAFLTARFDTSWLPRSWHIWVDDTDERPSVGHAH